MAGEGRGSIDEWNKRVYFRERVRARGRSRVRDGERDDYRKGERKGGRGRYEAGRDR